MTLAGVIGDLPDIALRAERVLTQLEDLTAKGITLERETVTAVGRAEARGRRWGTAALWIIAVSLMIALFERL